MRKKRKRGREWVVNSDRGSQDVALVSNHIKVTRGLLFLEEQVELSVDGLDGVLEVLDLVEA